MNTNPFTRGMTLLELLVVFVIVSLLTAIALPQYRLAVEKSRAKALLSVLYSVYNAQKLYYTMNGTYADSFEKLDIELPSSNTSRKTSKEYTFSNKTRIKIAGSGNTLSVQGYPNTQVPYFFEFYLNINYKNCWAQKDNAYANKICSALTGIPIQQTSGNHSNEQYTFNSLR